MAFGCECGDGWYEIIRGFCKLAHSHLENNTTRARTKNKENPRFVPCPKLNLLFLQIKEKYGTLRLYYHLSRDLENEPLDSNIDEELLAIRDSETMEFIRGLESFAEYLSARTCEVTGKPGKLWTCGWHRTLCDEEAIKFGYILDDGTKETNP
jgi:hypothetical protein